MATIAHSQLAPLPSELPFHIVSKTIGQGAYACIKKGRIPGSAQTFAVKFIHMAYAMKHGHVTKKQLDMEITLHKHLGAHANIVQFFQSGEDSAWKWIAMELAEGGDLFDKIESDVGVGEDIAHVYFSQLVNAIAFMHSKGVGHRDIKPENILLSSEGNLKIADFGLATLFSYNGKRKISTTRCGSPPYTAPEVVVCNAATIKAGQGYYGDFVDIWSCGVVLFVLLVGNTPWDEPMDRSYEFSEYVRTSGHPDDELWHKLPASTLSLLRGMLKVEPSQRFSLSDVRKHPWFMRQNPHLAPDGKLADPVTLATHMFEKIHIDFSQDPLASQRVSQPSTDPSSGDAMDIDSHSPPASKLPSTQPENPTADIMFDWETNPIPASQPLAGPYATTTHGTTMPYPSSIDDRFSEDPSLSQFTPAPTVPLSRTQFARRFGDILPAHSLTRFVSLWPLPALLQAITSALHKLGVPVAEIPAALPKDGMSSASGSNGGGVNDGGAAWIKVRAVDGRNCVLKGDVVVEKVQMDAGGGGGAGTVEVCQVVFIKRLGDPVEWRRLFKRVVVLCGGAVWRGE